MTRPIDRFVSALHRERADELILETGMAGRVRVGQEERVLLAQQVRTDQIEFLMRDIVPEEMQRIYRQDGELSFPYRSPAGPVMVHVRRSRDRLGVMIRPLNAPRPSRTPTPAPGFVHRSTAPLARVEPVPAPVNPLPPLAATPGAFLAPREGTPRPEGKEVDPISLDLSTSELPVLASGDLSAAPAPAPPAPVPPPRAPSEPRLPPSPAALSAAAPERRREPRRGKAKIDSLLQALLEQGGSDLHLTAGLSPRMRKDGEMTLLGGYPDPVDSTTINGWLMEIAPPKAQERFEATSDSDFAYELPGQARLRVNVFKDRRGTGGVIRVIPAKIRSADELGLPPVIRELCALDKGLVVVTGPTGSGKSTTLAAMIDLINQTRADHVITIEDPVEFVHPPARCLVNQREVHSDTESFSSGLRAALREDPDIVLVGEMRDLETTSIAVETAETGHLVFGTLHTNTAVSTVDRIIDQFPTDRQAQVRVMLSSALKGVIAQTLLKKIGGGRVAAHEILVSVPAVANLIREGKTFQIASIMQTGRALGMQTLNDALYALVRDGKVEAEEALAVAPSRAELKALLDRAEPAAPLESKRIGALRPRG